MPRPEDPRPEAGELQERLEHLVTEHTAALAAADREREELAHAISHDLRAPLRAIDGFARILQEQTAGQLSPQAADSLRRITSSAAHMNELIDALLDYSRAGRLELSYVDLDMDALVAATIHEFDLAVAGRAIQWVFMPMPPARADRALLRQIWVQLISNAIKFTRGRDPARIEIGVEAGGAAPAYYIRDNGAGYDPRYAQRLFNVFQRLHRRDEFDGSGVGLAIARRAVARHGGRIWAQGAPGEGACVRFTLWERTQSPAGDSLGRAED